MRVSEVEQINVFDKLEPVGWDLSVCSACHKPSLWFGEQLLWPVIDRQATGVPKPSTDIPGDARTLYEEARLVLPHSRRAAAALARASLEKCLRKTTGTTGKERLVDLIDKAKSDVSTSLWKLLTAIRHLGNATLHEQDRDDDLVALYLSGDEAEVVEPLFHAINQLVDELITRPNAADEIYSQIPQTVRDAAERDSGTEGATRRRRDTEPRQA